MADQVFTTQDPQQSTQTNQTTVPQTPQNTTYNGPFWGTISWDPTEIDITQDIPLPPLEDDFSLDLADPIIEKTEEKTQAEEIPEAVLTPVEVSIPDAVLPEITVAAVSEPVIASIVEPIIEPIEATPEVVLETKAETPVEETVITKDIINEEIADTVPAYSDIRVKFNELQSLLEKTYQIRKLPQDALISIIGANNDKLSLTYVFHGYSSQSSSIEKQETNKETDEQDSNTLSFSCNERDLLEVHLDDVLLFQETELLSDNKKKLLVMDKLNKFIFLVGEDYKKIEKEIKAQEEEAQERRRLQDVFRNF